jgi:hypothetical protein
MRWLQKSFGKPSSQQTKVYKETNQTTKSLHSRQTENYLSGKSGQTTIRRASAPIYGNKLGRTFSSAEATEAINQREKSYHANLKMT